MPKRDVGVHREHAVAERDRAAQIAPALPPQVIRAVRGDAPALEAASVLEHGLVQVFFFVSLIPKFFGIRSPQPV